MKILVCGGRDFNDRICVDRTLNEFLSRCGGCGGLTIIQGMAPGADSLARQWAEDNGVETIGFRASWNLYGKRAGYIRNVQMLNEGQPDLVVAFPGGAGTKMMINLAEAAGVPVVKIND